MSIPGMMTLEVPKVVGMFSHRHSSPLGACVVCVVCHSAKRCVLNRAGQRGGQGGQMAPLGIEPRTIF